MVEVDRFDLGRDIGSGLQPTALVPGDVIIFCTVGCAQCLSVCCYAVLRLARGGPLMSLSRGQRRICSKGWKPRLSLHLIYCTSNFTFHLHTQRLHSPTPSSPSHVWLTCQSSLEHIFSASVGRCVYPSSCYLTPVTVLPIVPTALARNLAGPLPLSVLQATVKWGWVVFFIFCSSDIITIDT